MEEAKIVFAEIVNALNQRGVFPIIYGSFGLYLKLKKPGVVNDIDLIIQSADEYPSCKEAMLSLGFTVDPDHDRELIRNDLNVSFLDSGEIERLINEPLVLTNEEISGSRFFNLELDQYKKIYEAGLQNKYRKDRKELDDLVKISEIDQHIIDSQS